MRTELEIKLQLSTDAELAHVLQICAERFGPSTGTLLQLDEYFDTVDEQLKQQDLTVRLRTVNEAVRVALKGPRIHFQSGVVNRIELEFLAADAKEVRVQLATLGLEVTAAIEKQRWTFRADHAEVMIDKLPFVGAFLEVEGVDEASVQTIVGQLGLASHEPVRSNYTEILEAHLAGLGLPLRPHLRATFESESSWKKRSRKYPFDTAAGE